MKSTLCALVLSLLVPALCVAEISIESVSKERAKKLGMELRLKGDGPNEFWVELEFKAEGELKDFKQVTMEIKDGDKFLLGYAPLQPHPSTDGRVLVGFMANRAFLDKVTLRVVTGASRGRSGHDLRVKDFVDLEKPR